jgi:hypothetical protein
VIRALIADPRGTLLPRGLAGAADPGDTLFQEAWHWRSSEVKSWFSCVNA